tara:strand:+ start:292 stop:450 length:159 start_codon:yes stop_codon:yes gene_type:complete
MQKIKFLIFLSFEYLSIKYIIQGIKAKANISGLKTSLIDIDGGKKLIKMKVR